MTSDISTPTHNPKAGEAAAYILKCWDSFIQLLSGQKIIVKYLQNSTIFVITHFLVNAQLYCTSNKNYYKFKQSNSSL